MLRKLLDRFIRPSPQPPPAGAENMSGLYEEFLRPGDLCFDIGANLGNRLRVFRKLGCRVVALEPQSSCYLELKEEFATDPAVILIQKAAAATETELEMRIASAHTISSLSPDWIQKVRESGRFRDYQWDKREKVFSTTLDSLIALYGLPRFIKIDVEGYEPEVLRGLSQPVPFLSFEWTPEFSIAMLASLAHLESIGLIETNYSLGESMKLASEHWLEPARLRALLYSMESDTQIFGDVYVRFPALLQL